VGLSGNAEFGGMGMPKMLAVQFEEMLYGANSSFALYSALSSGACLALDAHASETLKTSICRRCMKVAGPVPCA
jgi:alkylation response protein AidB-like acyl-CoA dehydrogenase